MNKILRYSLLALLAFVSNLTFAETVTFTAGETGRTRQTLWSRPCRC